MKRQVALLAWVVASWLGRASAAPALHATVRGPDVPDLAVDVGNLRLPWSALSRTRQAVGAATVSATFSGDATAIEVPHCSGRGAVTVDGNRYVPPPGPFVVRVAAQRAPHSVVMSLEVSTYERRVACSAPVRAGSLVETRDGLSTLTFPSPEARGGRAVLYVPPGHDLTKPGALLVGVHPWNGDEWTYAAYAELLAAARAEDVVLLMPSGLGNSLYTRAAENEVLRAIDAARGALAVDEARVSLWGASMGGQGACTIGWHRPDRFALVASYFGDARFNLDSYVRSIVPTAQAAHEVDPIDVVDNARNVPVVLVHGEADRTSAVRESDELAAALRQRGYTFEYDRVPGRGHEGLLVVEHIAAIVQRAAHARAPAHPPRVTFRSVRPEDVAAYGVRITRAGAGDAFVDIELMGAKVVVHAVTGVRRIDLGLGALGAPRNAPVEGSGAVEVRWD